MTRRPSRSKTAAGAGAKNLKTAPRADDVRTFLFMGQPGHEERLDRCRIYDGTGGAKPSRPFGEHHDSEWAVNYHGDRQETRHLGGLSLTAGRNHGAEAPVPWSVGEWRAAERLPTGPGGADEYHHDRYVTIASGTATSQAAAREAAETAAREHRAKEQV